MPRWSIPRIPSPTKRWWNRQNTKISVGWDTDCTPGVLDALKLLWLHGDVDGGGDDNNCWGHVLPPR